MNIGLFLYLCAPNTAFKRAAIPRLMEHSPGDWAQVWRATRDWQTRLAPSRPRHSANVNVLIRYMEWSCALYRAAQENGLSQTQAIEFVGAVMKDIFRPVPAAMYVTDEQSMIARFDDILQKDGSIDMLINNAGYGSYGAVEDVPIDKTRRQFDVNMFGLTRLTQLVLPKMRENKYGKIVNITSVGGKVYTPFGAWYHAAKHALEGWPDCLRLETQPFGVDVIIIEPGGIATEWGGIAADNLKKRSGAGAHAEAANKTADAMAQMYTGRRLSKPTVIANVIVKAVIASRPKTRYHAGAMSGLVLFLRYWLSDRKFDRVVKSMM